MDKIYFFSKNNFQLSQNNQIYKINNFQNIFLGAVSENNIITINQNCFGYIKQINLFPKLAKSNNFFDIYSFNGNTYIHFISLDFENLISYVITKNFSVKIYTHSILLIDQQNCFSYSFKSSKNNYVVEIHENLYIFNEYNLIKINTKTLISTTLLTKKLEVNSNIYEILCKTPKNNTYFILFKFDNNNNTVSVKKLKNENSVDNRSIPYLVFYLCKLEFEEVKNYISSQINCEDLKKYLNNFDEIIEIENEFFIYSKNAFEKISFTIYNNIVNEID